MNKTWLIIKREYLTRVRKITFIIGTLLFPILYLLLIFGTGYIAEKTRHVMTVAIVDQSGLFSDSLIKAHNQADESSVITLINPQTPADFKYDTAGYDAYVRIPKINWQQQDGSTFELHTKKSYGSATTGIVEAKLNRIWDEIKNEKLGIAGETRRIIASNRIVLKPHNDNDTRIDAELSNGIGMACGFLI